MDYDEAKSEVLSLHPAQVNAERVAELANRNAAEGGLVACDLNRRDTEGRLVFDPFLEAIYLGLSFCGTSCRFEWLVVSRALLPIVRLCPKFEEVGAIQCRPTRLVYLGVLGRIDTYLDEELPPGEFLTGICRGRRSDRYLCARGLVRGYWGTAIDAADAGNEVNP